MYVCKIMPHVLPNVTLFDNVSVDNCIHFQRTPDEYIAFFIVKGEMFLLEDGIRYHLKEGDFIQLEPGKEHVGYEFSDHCTYFYMHFHLDNFLVGEMNEYEIRVQLNKNRMLALQGEKVNGPIMIPKVLHTTSRMEYDLMLQMLNQGRQYYNGYKEFGDIQTSCILVEIFVYLSHLFSNQMLSKEEKSMKRSTLLVYQLLKEMNYNYAEKFSGHLIEKKFHCNFDYLNRIFKKETGQTIFAYLTKVRISQAKMLLISGNLAIQDIAMRVGYEDSYYFSNVFKKQTGYSPSQYRKLILAN